MNLKDEYQIKFLKHHVEEEKNNGKKLSVQEEDLKIEFRISRFEKQIREADAGEPSVQNKKAK